MTAPSTLLREAPSESEANWRFVDSTVVRQGDHPPVPAPIPGLLEGRVTLLAGAGGAGKTTLTEQLVRHMCSFSQLGKFDLPDKAVRGWCLYLEDVEAMAQDRSLRVAPYGSIWEDDRTSSNVRYLFGRGFRPYDLEQQLDQAQQESKLPGLVIIDHLRILIGPQPAGISPNDWERRNLLRLTDMADTFGTHIVVLTHLNKEGKVSGTTEMINSVDTAYVIEPNSEDPSYATLSCKKMRMSPEVDFPLMKRANGTWGLTDQAFVSETQALGIARDIVGVLKKEGRKTLSEIVSHHQIIAERAGIRSALTRGRKRGWFRLYRGHWEINVQAGDEAMRTPDPEPPTAPQPPAAPTVQPPAQRPAEAPQDPQEAPQAPEEDPLETERAWSPDVEQADTETFPAMKLLRQSVERSKYHPIPAILLAERDHAPWTHLAERTGGEPSWCAPGWATKNVKETDENGQVHRRREILWPETKGVSGTLLVLDRNGSYPSACSSVTLAPNKLIRRGPQDFYNRKLAGLYLVSVPDWDTDAFPHPLGRILRGGESQAWVTTPHMRLLNDLADEHRIKRVSILDSWLGAANGSLLERFYEECREKRVELVDGDEEEYKRYKTSLSIALRSLWPKNMRSRFWRPDWRLSMVAEAAVRHWKKADEAVQKGAQLVVMSNTDEAAYLTTDGELPLPYEEGKKFGQVKIKSREAR